MTVSDWHRYYWWSATHLPTSHRLAVSDSLSLTLTLSLSLTEGIWMTDWIPTDWQWLWLSPGWANLTLSLTLSDWQWHRDTDSEWVTAPAAHQIRSSLSDSVSLGERVTHWLWAIVNHSPTDPGSVRVTHESRSVSHSVSEWLTDLVQNQTPSDGNGILLLVRLSFYQVDKFSVVRYSPSQ